MIKGTTVILVDKQETGKDPFGNPIWEETEVPVDDILISPSTVDDIATSTQLCGKVARYTLAIPKGDTHTWEDREIRFFGKRWRSYGFVIEGLENLIPLRWHKKVMVERYE